MASSSSSANREVGNRPPNNGSQRDSADADLAQVRPSYLYSRQTELKHIINLFIVFPYKPSISASQLDSFPRVITGLEVGGLTRLSAT